MRYVRKEFLTSCAGETGNIVCQITTNLLKDFNRWTAENGGYINGSIKISDCSESIQLDFDATGQKSYEKRVAKFDKLIAEIEAMRHQYIAMWENHQRDLKHYELTKDKE